MNIISSEPSGLTTKLPSFFDTSIVYTQAHADSASSRHGIRYAAQEILAHLGQYHCSTCGEHLPDAVMKPGIDSAVWSILCPKCNTTRWGYYAEIWR